jgi:hypothetical protein
MAIVTMVMRLLMTVMESSPMVSSHHPIAKQPQIDSSDLELSLALSVAKYHVDCAETNQRSPDVVVAVVAVVVAAVVVAARGSSWAPACFDPPSNYACCQQSMMVEPLHFVVLHYRLPGLPPGIPISFAYAAMRH